MLFAMIARRLQPTLSRALFALVAVALSATACDKVPLTAPSESIITLFATATSVSSTGSTDIVATVIESSGTPVQNGTVVSFTTTLGRIEPSEARTRNGKVTVKFTADGRSGVALVTAFSGGATGGGTDEEPQLAQLELAVGSAAAATVTLRAQPGTLPPGGGSTEIVALVRDEAGNPVSGATVGFSTTAGNLSSGSALTDANGEARTILAASRDATVTATVGAADPVEIDISVDDALGLDVDVSANPTAGATTTFSIVVTVPPGANPASRVEIDFGDGESRSLNVPSTGGTTTVAHIYDEDGTYTVRVRVIDTAGRTQSQDLVIAVQPGLAVTLTASDTTPATGQSVTFTAIVSGGIATNYEWTFGDGSGDTTGIGGSTTHMYNLAGPKTVKVRVFTVTGSEARDELVVTVH
jgi:Bacterial Ig-like domain (group 1)/PKD domain